MPYYDMLHVDLVSVVTADALGDDAIDTHNLSVISQSLANRRQKVNVFFLVVILSSTAVIDQQHQHIPLESY